MGVRDSAVLSDGTVVSGNADAVDLAVSIDQDLRARECDWIDSLREQGVKAAHPDDGWVDRDENKVHLAYPQFNDGLTVGDLLALGWDDKWRLVRVTETSELQGLGGWLPPSLRDRGPWYFHFEPVAEVVGDE